MACNCVPNANNSGNDVYWIPLKPGFPLSSACERGTVIGAIPDVIRFPNFTLISGGVAANRVSNGGIGNPSDFFTKDVGCYGDLSQYPSNCA